MMNEFQYLDLPVDHALVVRSATERIHLRMKRASEDIVEIGRDLIEVKKVLPHGQFGHWLQAEFEMTDRTAQNFIRVAEKFGNKNEIIAFFNPTILYELSAPSTPDPVVVQAIKKIETGEKVTVADVQKWKAAHKKAQDKVSELEKEVEGLQNLPPVVVERLPAEIQNIHLAVEAKKSELGEINMQIQDANKKLGSITALKKENAALKKEVRPDPSAPSQGEQIPVPIPFLSKETAILAMTMASEEVMQGGRPHMDVREYYKFLDSEHAKIGEVVARF